jgi:hypothetical protein
MFNVLMVRKLNYLGFVLILILICILMTLAFINPHSIYKSEFNKTFENSQSDINLKTVIQIVDYIEKRMMNIPGDVLRLKQKNLINYSQEEEIIKTLDMASSEFLDYKNNYQEENLYQALFYSQASLAYYKSYPFINCANEVSIISSKYTPFFYYLSQSDKERVSKIIGTSNRLENYLEDNSYYRNNTDNIIRRAKEVFEIEQDFDFYELKCEQFKSYLEKDYSRQQLFFFFKLGAGFLILIVGILIGSYFNKKNFEKITDFGDRVRNIWSKIISPRDIREETIKAILKKDSLIATLVIFISIIYTVGDIISFIMAIFVFAIVILLILSILLGIISINNNSLTARRYSYLFFVLGIILFVGFFIYLILGGMLFNILDIIGDSAQNFLNNQTGIK